ncbi:hypothetical protein BY996DRAFT_6464616 [Phakopsora pachyrhizi]|nr:hypothetical protein BY996DRAFT_6464616 [Phakopsora pachyrhizi]
MSRKSNKHPALNIKSFELPEPCELFDESVNGEGDDNDNDLEKADSILIAKDDVEFEAVKAMFFTEVFVLALRLIKVHLSTGDFRWDGDCIQREVGLVRENRDPSQRLSSGTDLGFYHNSQIGGLENHIWTKARRAGRKLAWLGWAGKAGAWLGLAGLGPGRLGLGLAGLGWVLVGRAGRAGKGRLRLSWAWLGWVLGWGLGGRAGKGRLGLGLAWLGWVLGQGRLGLGLAWQGRVLGGRAGWGLAWLGRAGSWEVGQAGQARSGWGLAGMDWAGLGPGQVGEARQAGARLGLAGLGPGAGHEIRTKLRPVLKPERQAEGFWVEASGVENLQLVRDVDHVAVVEKASFESGCDVALNLNFEF